MRTILLIGGQLFKMLQMTFHVYQITREGYKADKDHKNI